MKPPNPSALRLKTRARTAEAPAPPFGLRFWSPNAAATAILLDATDGDLDDVAAVSFQIPPATALAPATPLVVLGATAGARGVWRRLFGGGSTAVARALRCSALLVRGYVDIGAGLDRTTGGDLAWGWSPLP
jgi:hypothetical protein